MKPSIYSLLVVTVISLSLTYTVQAQMSREQSPVQSNSLTTNNSKQLPGDVTAEWYNQALTSIRQLEEQIKPAQPFGGYRATNTRSRTCFNITPSGYKVRSLEGNPWEVAFQLKGIGRSKMQWKPTGGYSISNTANELQYDFINGIATFRQPVVNTEHPSPERDVWRSHR